MPRPKVLRRLIDTPEGKVMITTEEGNLSIRAHHAGQRLHKVYIEGHKVGKEAHAFDFYVEPGWREKGLASEMLKLFEDNAIQHGCDVSRVKAVHYKGIWDSRPFLENRGYEIEEVAGGAHLSGSKKLIK